MSMVTEVTGDVGTVTAVVSDEQSAPDIPDTCPPRVGSVFEVRSLLIARATLPVPDSIRGHTPRIACLSSDGVVDNLERWADPITRQASVGLVA